MKTLIFLLSLTIFASRAQNEECPDRVDVIYIETNNFQANQNGILAYRNLGDGTLEELPGSPFPTEGTGVGNPKRIIGPENSDTQIKITNDGKFLLAVNSGSDTISVFRILSDGSLEAVQGSPFPSGGQTPVSIGIRGFYVYVVNKSQNPLRPITEPPNYTTFIISETTGELTPVPDSTFETTPGSSPAQILISNDGKFAFGVDFAAFTLKPPQGALRSFTVDDGILTPVEGTPIITEGVGATLGLWQHPEADVLYVGHVLDAKTGIYTIGESGELELSSTIDANVTICWFRATKDGKYLYGVNGGSNSITIYDSSDPLSLQIIDEVPLKESGPTYVGPRGFTFYYSQAFTIELSPSQEYLYVVSQHVSNDFFVGNYNYLHVLKIEEDGRLTEIGDPLQLPIPNIYRPQGTAVIQVDNECQINNDE